MKSIRRFSIFSIFSLVLSVSGLGCGGPGGGSGGDDDGPGEGCSDQDQDGYGAGPECEGPDCNDWVADVHDPEQCEQFCDEVGDFGPGCPCESAEPEVCYLGPAGTSGVGICRGGIMSCDDGVWSGCAGMVVPGDEVCNEADDDCDAEVDEGVLSTCGDCNPDCEEDCIGVGCDEAFDPAGEGTSVVATPEGGLTLGGETGVRNHVIWIANSPQGTVSKIDTRERVETGRYSTGEGGGGKFGGGPDPSRTTVNPHGDVVVANRGNGDAVKFYASDCPDADGDGRIDTSDGTDDVLAFEADECWAWTTQVGSGARGSAFEVRMGLDAAIEEFVWIGDYAHMDIHEIESESGDLTGRTIPGVNPYGVALGPGGKLWTFGSFGNTLSVTDTEDLDTEEIPIAAGEYWYGITVDGEGRVWIGGSVARYDPEDETWESPEAGVSGAGIAADADGNAWVGTWKVDGETMEGTRLGGLGGYGWAIDFDGFAWGVPMNDSAYVYDPDDLDMETVTPPLQSPYTYSDMTGFQLVNATHPSGTYVHVFEACVGAEVRWSELSWEGVVPAGTSLGFRVKTAGDLGGLAAASYVDLGTSPPAESPLSLADALDGIGVTHGNVLQVEVTLRSIDRDGAPVLDSMSVSRSCEVPIG